MYSILVSVRRLLALSLLSTLAVFTTVAFVTAHASKAQAQFGGWQIPGLSSTDGDSGSFKNSFGSRSYKVYVPKKNQGRLGLLVVLHGCFLTGDQMATGTEFNKIADQRGFSVLYPEQTYSDNSWKCWNWFKPENQTRDGESSIIAGMTKEMLSKYKIDAKRVYVTGLSAGSAMAANLLACYSDIFAGGLLHSGLEYAAAQNENDAHSVMSTGPAHDLDEVAAQAMKCSVGKRKSLMPVIVVHGTSDPYVATINADRTATLFEKLNTAIFLSQGGKLDQVTRAEGAITQDGFNFSAKVSDVVYNSTTTVRKVMVQKMGHGWSGGQPNAPYMEPRGINATKLLVESFFP